MTNHYLLFTGSNNQIKRFNILAQFGSVISQSVSILYHQFEVIVVVNVAAHIVVVFEPFVQCDLAVLSLLVLHTVLSLERVQELVKYVVFCAPAHHYFWVLLGIVLGFDVDQVDNAVVIVIHLLESSCTDSLTTRVHLSHDCSDKLIV